MSNVYEALRKAEQERLSRKNQAERVEPAATAEPRPETALAESAHDAGAPLKPADAGAKTAPVANGAKADFSVTARREAEEFALLRPISEEARAREHIPQLIRRGREAEIATEQFQVLRTFIEDWVAEHSKRVILLTSALRQEGKSFVAINLAASLASPQTPVVLVDADCRVPSVHRAFNLTPMAGLLTYLEGRATLAECLHETHIPGLSVLPAGGVGIGNPEAFAGTRMRRLLDELRALSPAHYVLIDAPAAMAAPETRILARLTDAGLLVVAANVTPRKFVSQTIEMLNPLPFCGVVFNRFEAPYSTERRLRYKYGYPERGSRSDGASI